MSLSIFSQGVTMQFSPQYSKTAPVVQKVKDYKILQSIGVSLLVLLAMAVSYVLPNAMTHNLFAINPRTIGFTEIAGIMGSWLAHVDSRHLTNNMSVMFLPLIYFFYQTRKRSWILWFALIVFMSGFMTWLLGSSAAVVVGASGLAYALFGFILTGTFRSIGCFLMTALTLFLYLTPMLTGLVPQDGVSWAGHAGGAIAGYIIGKYFIKVNDEKEFAYKMKFKDKMKQKISDLKWKFSKRRNRYYQ